MLISDIFGQDNAASINAGCYTRAGSCIYCRFYENSRNSKYVCRKTEILDIENYRALLPCDYSQMIQVRKLNGPTFRYSSDSFHMSECRASREEFTDLTYKIQGNIIYTSIKEGEIEVAYLAIATDSEGYPLLPDNSSYTRALELYIKNSGLLYF